MARKILNSRTCTSLALFALLTAVVSSTGLLENIHQQFAKTNERFVTKVPRIYQKPSSTDVLIIGSSLIQVPAVRCDDDMREGRTRYDSEYYDHIFQYDKADYLQWLLSSKLGRNISCLNGAVAATNLADQYLLFKEFLANGSSCKLAVLCVSPRELHDNYHSEPMKTQVFDVLGNPFSLQAIKTRGLESCLSLQWQRMNPLFANRLQLQRASIANVEPRVFATAAHAKPAPAADYVQPKNTLRDLKMWHDTYNPVNWKLYNLERGYLEAFLKLAQEHGIPVAVVDMPLPRPTLSVIPPELLKRYDGDLSLLSAKYDAKLLRPSQEDRYRVMDFEDGGHMVVSGGKKLFESISEHLVRDGKLNSALAASHHVNGL